MDIEAAKKAWPRMNATQRKIFVERMRDLPKQDPTWQDWLRNRPIDELRDISKLVVPTKELPLDAEGRMFVKNFSNNPEASIKELKKLNPDIEDISWRNGRIQGRKKGEDFYRVLDPAFGEWSDTLSDVGDVLYDAVDTAVTTAAGAAGFFGGGPVGAAASGGAVSAGMEALRQGLGKYFGLDQEMDTQRIGRAGLLGMVPAVGGSVGRATGKAAIGTAQIAGPAIEKAGKVIDYIPFNTLVMPKSAEIASYLAKKITPKEEFRKNAAGVIMETIDTRNPWSKMLTNPYLTKGAFPAIYHGATSQEPTLEDITGGGSVGPAPRMR